MRSKQSRPNDLPPPPPEIPAPIDETTAYALDVVAGDVVAGPYVRAACARHLRDLESGAERGLRWDVEEAARALGFFRTLLTVEIEAPGADGANESRSVRFLPQPWQAFVIGSLFGWRNAGGFRRFRRAYVEVAKGNGKSPLAAGIGHYMMLGTGKKRAEIYSAATDRDQAEILFRDAVSMRENSDTLSRILRPKGKMPVTELIRVEWNGSEWVSTGSFFKPISSDKKGKSGIRPYCALVDEVHEHPDNSVIEMLRAGTKGNQEALIFEITNSGFDKRSVCGREHDYSVEVVTGVLANDAWFAFIACVDEGDEPFEDESCWVKANPNLGVSIQPEFIREQVREAKGMPSKESFVRRLHFCQWTGSDAAAIPRALWTAATKRRVNVEALRNRAFPCYGGLDLSRTRDLCAFTLTWLLDPTPDAWRFESRTWFWTPKATLAERSKIDRAPYDLWASQGYLEAVPGKRVSYRWIAQALAALNAEFAPEQIGCDQYGLEQLQDQLDDIGVTLPCVVHPQGFNRRKVGDREDELGRGAEDTGAEDIVLWMPDSINKLEAALLEERLAHDPNPVMTMCASSVVFAQNRTGHRMFDKEKATHRIDGMVSLAMSIGVATSAALAFGNLDDFLSSAVMHA